MNEWIYDEEIYPNLFLLAAKHPINNDRLSFEISPRKDQRNELLEWLKQIDNMIGYNNLFYDYPVLEYIIKYLFTMRGRDLTSRTFKFSSELIRGKRFVSGKHHFVKQTDLFKINHFDNVAKSTSLKLLEFNLKMKDIQELPYPPGTVLTNEQIQHVVDYCHNDTDATHEVWKETKGEIELREKMSPMFGIDFTNYNSSKMGEQILVSKIIESLGEHKVYNLYETPNGTKRSIINTKRDIIDFSDVVFDYISFKTEPFQKILSWFKSKKITETKGTFSNIPVSELNIIEGHYAKFKVGWNDDKQEMVTKPMLNTKDQLKTLNIVNFDFQYDFGVGGIHGSILSGIYQPAEDECIRDIDVASYYPNLAIKNKFYPEHYGEEFCEIYEGIYKLRQTYPKKTHKLENLALKLALNGSYGKSNSKYSPLYDPMYTMKTTVNGQLLLCMLSEELMTRVPDCLMLQINTDGMTIKYKNCYSGLVDVICNEWERLTQLELEHAYYSSMIIKDVNNYLAISVDGWVKRKGAAFIYKQTPGELELHKNFSNLIVPKALEAYFTDGIEPEHFIQNHDNVFDFFKRTKIRKSDKLLNTIIDINGNLNDVNQLQRITRYLITGEVIEREKEYHCIGEGYVLIKQMPATPSKVVKLLEESNITKEQAEKQLVRRNNIESGYLCTECNSLDNIEDLKSKIYYPYYIKEVYKVIKQLENDYDGQIHWL